MTKLSSIKDTEDQAKSLAQKIKNGGVLLMFGNLGSGKTTLTKFIAEEMGIDKFSVKSPTYTYIRKYGENFYHLDLYRLEAVDEILLQEIMEIWDEPKNIVVIEWAEKLGDHIPEKHTSVTLQFIDKDTRTITIENVDR